MSIRANITLTDAAGTPVNRVYYPFKGDEKQIWWVDRTQEIAAGQNRLTVSQRPAGANAATNNIEWRLTAPILAVTAPTTSTGIQPVPTVDHTNAASIKLELHARATTQERKDLLAQLRDLIDEAIVTNQVENLDFIW